MMAEENNELVEALEQEPQQDPTCTIIVNSNNSPPSKTLGPSNPPEGFKETVKWALRNVSIEPVCFMLALALYSEFLIIQNLTLYKICHLDLKFPANVCRHLNDPANHDAQSEVQPLASKFGVYKSIVEHIVPFFSSLYMGAWSDRYGRRWLLLMMMFGLFLDEIGHLINSIWLDNPKEYILLFSSLPYSLGGGFVALRVSVFSYIADISTPEMRTMRLALVDAAFCLAGPAGNLLGGLVFKKFDFPGTFVVALCLTFAAGVLTLLLMDSKSHLKSVNEETMVMDGEERTTCKTLFDVKHVKESVQVCLKTRDRDKRSIIWLQFFVILLSSIAGSGEWSVAYLFTRRKFKWDEVQFGFYTTLCAVFAVLGNVVGLPLMARYLSDTGIGILACGVVVSSKILQSMAPTGWLFNCVAVLQVLSTAKVIIGRSMLSKVVSNIELGKIYAVLGSVEALVPVFGTLIYNNIYAGSLNFFPGIIFLVSAVLMCFVLVAYVWMHRINLTYALFPGPKEREPNSRVIWLAMEPVNA